MTQGICVIGYVAHRTRSIMTLRSTSCKMAVRMLPPHFESLLHYQFAKTRRTSSADLQMATSVPLPSIPNGMPIFMQACMKGMQPPATIPHMRISGGNIRPPATSNLAPVLSRHQPSHQQSNADSSPTPASSASPTLPLSTDGNAVKASYIPNGAPVLNGPTSYGSTQQTPEASALPRQLGFLHD